MYSEHLKEALAAVLGGVVILFAQAPALGQPSSLVYANTATKTGQVFAPASGTEFGNEVILAAPEPSEGSNPQWGITGCSFEYNTGNAPANSGVGTVTLNIYANTGPSVAGPDSQAPGSTPLYTSSAIPLLASGTSGALVTFTGLNVVVPSVFTWTVTFNSPAGVTVGLDTYGPPNVGNAYNDIWEKSGSTWALFAPNGTIQANGAPANFATFGAEFSTEVPEPGMFSLGLLGLAASAGAAIGRGPRRPIQR